MPPGTNGRKTNSLHSSVAKQFKNDVVPGEAKILRPGQQATIASSIQVDKVDTADAVSWKDGYFQYNDESIEIVMKDIARWYNVNVIFKGAVTDKKLSARVSR